MTRAIVCGAGAAGLGAAAMLQKQGVEVTVLERGESVGTSWRNRYDGLRLNTTAFMSTLPGYRAGRRRYGEFPSRDDWVRYLEDYARDQRVQVRVGVEARRIEPDHGGWSVHTTDDETLQAEYVVVATGFDREPDLPDWPGREGFTGELLHSSDYRNPSPFRGRDVLVVGPGTTGSEIANFLVKGGATRVRLASRTTPNVLRRKFLGLSVNLTGVALSRAPLAVTDTTARVVQRLQFGDLAPYGIPRSQVGLATALMVHHRTPVYDEGFVAELKAGRIEIVAAVIGFEGAEVLLADGSRLAPDAVIAATGYRRGLDKLVGHLGLLDEHGVPVVTGGQQHPSAPGLFFAGYRADLTGQLRRMRHDARAIAKAVSR